MTSIPNIRKYTSYSCFSSSLLIFRLLLRKMIDARVICTQKQSQTLKHFLGAQKKKKELSLASRVVNGLLIIN